MRRVKTNGEHNKKECPEVNGVRSSTRSMIVSMGMNVSMKRKDNKMVMGHNRHYNQKWNITRSLELRIGDKSENREH